VSNASVEKSILDKVVNLLVDSLLILFLVVIVFILGLCGCLNCPKICLYDERDSGSKSGSASFDKSNFYHFNQSYEKFDTIESQAESLIGESGEGSHVYFLKNSIAKIKTDNATADDDSFDFEPSPVHVKQIRHVRGGSLQA